MEAFFTLPENTLRALHLGAGEAAAESEDREEQQGLLRQAKMIDAIGNWRFPNTWGDGLPIDLAA